MTPPITKVYVVVISTTQSACAMHRRCIYIMYAYHNGRTTLYQKWLNIIVSFLVAAYEEDKYQDMRCGP